MKYSTVLFDLDGTLTDPVQGICGSVRYALEKAGRPVGPIESYHKYIGLPLLRSFEGLCERDTGGGAGASRLLPRAIFDRRSFLKTRYIRAFRSCCAI